MYNSRQKGFKNMTKRCWQRTKQKMTINLFKKCTRNLQYFWESVAGLHMLFLQQNIQFIQLVSARQLKIIMKPVPAGLLKINKNQILWTIQHTRRKTIIHHSQTIVKNRIHQYIQLLTQQWTQKWRTRIFCIQSKTRVLIFWGHWKETTT